MKDERYFFICSLLSLILANLATWWITKIMWDICAIGFMVRLLATYWRRK